MLNLVVLSANLASEPSFKTLPSGVEVANLYLASSNYFTDKNGIKQQKTCFIEATAWGRTAQIVRDYVHKGDRINISGELEMQQWEDDKGVHTKHIINNISLDLLPKRDSSTPRAVTKPAYSTQASSASTSEASTQASDDGVIPF